MGEKDMTDWPCLSVVDMKERGSFYEQKKKGKIFHRQNKKKKVEKEGRRGREEEKKEKENISEEGDDEITFDRLMEGFSNYEESIEQRDTRSKAFSRYI